MSNYDEVLVWVEWQPSEATVFNNAIGDLANIDGLMTAFQLQEVVGQDALGVMVRPAGGVLESFEIRFRIDDDGVWRLWSF